MIRRMPKELRKDGNVYSIEGYMTNTSWDNSTWGSINYCYDAWFILSGFPSTGIDLADPTKLRCSSKIPMIE